MLLEKLLSVLHEALHEKRCHFKYSVFKLAHLLGVGDRDLVVEFAVAVINLHDDCLHRTSVFVFGLSNLLTTRLWHIVFRFCI